MPLLGELCRVIAYEYHEEGRPHAGRPHPSPGAVDMLGMFLEVIGLERVYLASQSVGWPTALHFALQRPEGLEGLVLIGAHTMEMDTVRGVMALQARLHAMTVPTLVLLEGQVHAAFPCAEVLAQRLPRCTKIVVSDAGATGSRSWRMPGAQGAVLPLSPAVSVPALQLGHAMMRFLLHCERQRNLVRGASFLL